MAFFQSGAFRHGTAVTPHSDVDQLARIHFADQPDSFATTLNGMNTVRRDDPVVPVEFPGVIARYEITPGFWLPGSGDSNWVLHIPASAGARREAAPTAHRAFVSRTDRGQRI